MFDKTHSDRGRVLLAVRIHSVGWTLLLWAVLIAWAGAVGVIFLHRPHLNRLGNLLSALPALGVLSSYLLYPRIKFYEGGIEIPPTRDNGRARYLRWDQIERSSWDGDRLLLTGTSSVLAGGPVQGGAIPIPCTQHPNVEQVLSTRLAIR